VDGWVAERLHDLVVGHPLVIDVLEAITFLGKPELLALLAALVGLRLVLTGHVRLGLFVVVAVIGGWLVDNGLKELIGRERPVFDDPVSTSSGPSFPSGHAMTSTAAYGAVVLLARRRAVTVAAIVLVVAIGITRIVLGVHWVTDVLGGWVVGAAWVLLCARVLLRGEEDLRPRDRAAAEDLPRAPRRDGEAEPR
jgi:undecaprenyl-diphosphatase